jgi:hypothetical protein
MAATFSFTPKSPDSYYTVSELNVLFSTIKSYIDSKLDVRGDTLQADLSGADIRVLNVAPPLESDDPLRVENGS